MLKASIVHGKGKTGERDVSKCIGRRVRMLLTTWIAPVESHLRHYMEPSETVTGVASSALLQLDADLPPGMLTHNLGIQLVIVCTKVSFEELRKKTPALIRVIQADQINVLERDKDYREDQIDYIQQALRTIALKCERPRASSGLSNH